MSNLLSDNLQRIKGEIDRLQERSAALDRVAAGPWQEGEPEEYKCYLVEVAVKGAKGRENSDVTVVRYDRYAGWQVDEWHTEVLRYAEINSEYE